MIYEYYIPLYMTLSMESPYLESQGLQLTWDKIFIVRDENGAKVETRTFFSLPFDLILAPFVKELEVLYEWKPGMSGMQPYSPVAVFKAILYAKLNKNMSDRELERHLLRNPHVAGALGFNKVPSHQTFSHFKRERLTIEILEEIFNALRDYLVNLGIIDFSSVTIDSAPIIAFVNLAKANREVKLDDSLACVLFEDAIYKSLARQLIERLNYKKSFPEHMKKRLGGLNMLVLYELGGFLSYAKVSKYLKKKDHLILQQAISSGANLPSEVTFSNFRKRFQGAVETEEFIAFEEYIESFFSRLCCPYDCSVPLFFPTVFAVLQTSCSLVDPDARLGYCAAKKQKFLGYRVQLLIDDKKKYP